MEGGCALRSLRIFATFLLFVTEIVWLGFQPVQLPAGVPAASTVTVGGLVASVEQEAHMIILRLKGHRAGAEPTVQVMAGPRDLSAYLRFREDLGTETSVRLSYAGVNMFPARLLTYTWEVDGQKVTGEHIYVHPTFPFRWELEQHDPFTFYHTGTLTAKTAADWIDHYTDLADFLSLEPVERTIYVLPNVDALQKALGSEGTEPKVAGLWIETLDAVLVSSDFPAAELRRIIYHELTHAFLANRNPSWWEEGIATWAEAQMSRRHGIWAGDLFIPQRAAALQEIMRTEGTFLVRATHSQPPPLDPYSVGYSFIMYLQDRFGQEAVLRLAAAAAEQEIAEAVMAVLGEDLDTLEIGWQAYLKEGGPELVGR